jgi:hypothetical protein
LSAILFSFKVITLINECSREKLYARHRGSRYQILKLSETSTLGETFSMRLLWKSRKKSVKKTRVDRKSAAIPQNLLNLSAGEGFYALKNMKKDEQKKVWDWAREVIRQYDQVLEKNPTSVKPAALLPASKENIELAIKVSLPFYITKNLNKMIAKLTYLYQELGAFQDFDPEDMAKIAEERFSNKNNIKSKLPEAVSLYNRFMDLSVAEKKRLLEEINQYVNDVKAFF